jgi:hypothetical protein
MVFELRNFLVILISSLYFCQVAEASGKTYSDLDEILKDLRNSEFQLNSKHVFTNHTGVLHVKHNNMTLLKYTNFGGQVVPIMHDFYGEIGFKPKYEFAVTFDQGSGPDDFWPEEEEDIRYAVSKSFVKNLSKFKKFSYLLIIVAAILAFVALVAIFYVIYQILTRIKDERRMSVLPHQIPKNLQHMQFHDEAEQPGENRDEEQSEPDSSKNQRLPSLLN